MTPTNHRSTSVLIVDRSEESRDVLRTILENRGVNILEARQGAEGLELLREQHPRVVVLDLELDETDSTDLQEAFEDASSRSASSLVMLGKVKGVDRSDGVEKTPPAKLVISKPYHYGPLIRTIERLLVQQQ